MKKRSWAKFTYVVAVENRGKKMEPIVLLPNISLLDPREEIPQIFVLLLRSDVADLPWNTYDFSSTLRTHRSPLDKHYTFDSMRIGDLD